MPHANGTARFCVALRRSTFYVLRFRRRRPSARCRRPPPTGNATVVDAVKRQDKTVTRTLLKQKADVNAVDAEGMTALHWAAHWDDLDTVKLLIKAGAKAKVANRYGVTPLHEACTVGNVPMIEALLDAGADPNAVLGEGETPLMTAARTGNTAAVRLLAVRGANVNATEAFRGQTALMWAAAENHEAVARLLVELGADVNVRSTHYEFPALTGGNGGIIHDRSEGGLTALMFAARQGSLETTDRLLAAGADINASEPQYGFTALQTAIFNGHYELASRLAGKGANVNDGALYTAIETRNLATYSNRPNPPDIDNGVTSLDLIKTLLAHGADPNLPYTKRIPPRQAQGDINVPPGATPLYRATRATDLAAIRALLDKGANPNLAARDGSTPLMVAAGFGARRGRRRRGDGEGGPRRPGGRHEAVRGGRREGQHRQRGRQHGAPLRRADRLRARRGVSRRQRRHARREEQAGQDAGRSRESQRPDGRPAPPSRQLAPAAARHGNFILAPHGLPSLPLLHRLRAAGTRSDR